MEPLRIDIPSAKKEVGMAQNKKKYENMFKNIK